LASQGHQAKIQIFPWTRVLSYLRSEKVDGIIAIWHSKERDSFIRFSDHYLTNDLVFISHVKRPFEYRKFSDLKGKKVGVIHKYAYDEEFNSSKIYMRDVGFALSSNLEKVYRGRIDITLDDFYVLKHALKKNKELRNSIYFSKTPLKQTKLYFGTKKGTQKGEKLIKIFNQGLKEIKANGTYQQILSNYFK
jgi:polar amino acid transport system substrate-binding protein